SFELIALDDVAYLVFAEVAQLDSALQSRTHLLNVVMETPQSGNPTVINRLSPPDNASPRHARDAAVSDKASRDDSSAKLKDLLHFSVSNDRFSMLGLQ